MFEAHIQAQSVSFLVNKSHEALWFLFLWNQLKKKTWDWLPEIWTISSGSYYIFRKLRVLCFWPNSKELAEKAEEPEIKLPTSIGS